MAEAKKDLTPNGQPNGMATMASTHDEQLDGATSCKIGPRERVKHFTWAWFLSTMSTGGLAIALAEAPYQFPGLYYIGLVIFLLNVTLFIVLATLMTVRAILHTDHFKSSFRHPMESFFFGSFWLSASVIIGGIQVYGITYGPAYPWLVNAVYVLYWLYCACSFLNSVFQYWILIQSSAVRPVPSLPSIFLAGYTSKLAGVIAALIAGSQSPHRAVLIVVSGLAWQGFGWCISFFAIVMFIKNLLDNGLPPPALRPAMFIPVGSCAYMVIALLGMANGIPDDPSYGYFLRHPTAAETLRVTALFIGIFIWLFGFWFFLIAFLGSITVAGKMPFSLTWWAFIFPNVGLTVSTTMIGKELESEAMLRVASAMTILLVMVWLMAVAGCIRAVWQKKIVWPGKDEDKNR